MKIFRIFMLAALMFGAFSSAANVRAEGTSMEARPVIGPEGGGDPGLNGTVHAVVVNGADVYLGGDFTNAYGIPEADYIVKWNGSSWSALGHNGAGNGALNSGVRAIAVSGGNVYVGGNFYNASNNGAALTAADCIAKWDGTNWSALGNNGAGNGSLGGSVYAIAINGTDIYAGGNFINVNNNGAVLNAADYVAKWNGSNWSALGSNGAGSGSLNAVVSVITINGSTFYMGGSFTDVNNNGVVLGAADYVAKWNGSNWSALGSDGAGDGALNSAGIPSEWVAAIALIGSDVYVGGYFADVNNNGAVLDAADFIAKWDGTDWSALGGDGSTGGSLNGYVYSISVTGFAVYVGGSFTDVNNKGTTLGSADYIARWDGFNWSAVGNDGAGNGSLNGPVYSIAPGPYATGGFSAVNNHGVVVNKADHIAYWSGSDWMSLHANVSASPNSLNFGNQKVGSASAPREVILTNQGKQDLVVDTLTVSPEFGISGDLCSGKTIAAAATCTFNVVFSPTVSGIKTGQVTIPDNTLNTPDTVILGGTGIQQTIFRSSGAQDGWILETGENTTKGGTMNSADTTLRLGDDAAKKQYRAVLSFATNTLPDNAVITKVTLKVKKQAISGGGNPVAMFQSFMVDIKKGIFGTAALQASDFQTAATKSYGPFNTAVGAWYAIPLTTGKAYVNKMTTGGGLTQIRLRFKLDDNNNAAANYLSIYSGNAPAASRPQLIVEYYVP
jgi:hypothetical protein